MTESLNNLKSPRLVGKVVLVTGAGSGIGAAAALAYAREGARVVLAGRRQAELNAVASQIESARGAAAVVPTDVSDAASVSALLKHIVERIGRLDAAFNNAGISAYAPIEQSTTEDFDRVMATNVRGVWLLIKHEIEVMRAQGQRRSDRKYLLDRCHRRHRWAIDLRSEQRGARRDDSCRRVGGRRPGDPHQ